MLVVAADADPAGGTVIGRRMVALKNSPVWMAISRFGRPYPPFDFGSGMGLIDIERDEAEALGLLAPGDQVEPSPAGYNEGLELSARDFWKDDTARYTLKNAFGDQIYFEQGRAIWAGEKLLELFDDGMTGGPQAKGSFRFGKASGLAINKAAVTDLHEQIDGKQLMVSGSHFWHAMDQHGPKDFTRPGSGERRKTQLPLRRDEFRNLNLLWMEPAEVVLADEGKSGILFRRPVRGGILEMVVEPNPFNPDLLSPVSIRKKKRPTKEKKGGAR